jgi:Icc-related predicted phosphoesterase
MKLVCISDTHGEHEKVKIPECDVLIHAGDLTPRGESIYLQSLFAWFEKQPCKHVIVIGGNHDFLLQESAAEAKNSIIDQASSKIHYLEAGSRLHDASYTIDHIKFWGSPYTPYFYNWAFNFPERDRGSFARAHWDTIPEDTDVVVTHGPAYQILDQTARGPEVGCVALRDRLRVVKPKLHVCGHIHEAYGQKSVQDTHYVNASVLNLQYVLANGPVSITI